MSTETPAAPPTTKPKGKQTGYIVLRQAVDGGPWTIAGADLKAASAQAAIRAILEEAPELAGKDSFVAIPLRSWHPVKPKLTTRTVVTLENA